MTGLERFGNAMAPTGLDLPVQCRAEKDNIDRLRSTRHPVFLLFIFIYYSFCFGLSFFFFFQIRFLIFDIFAFDSTYENGAWSFCHWVTIQFQPWDRNSNGSKGTSLTGSCWIPIDGRPIDIDFQLTINTSVLVIGLLAICND